MKIKLLFGVSVCAALVSLGPYALAQSKPGVPQDRAPEAAFSKPDGNNTLGGTSTYFAGFEPPDYTLGDVNMQQMWFAQFGNWTVSDTSPGEGAQHVQGLSDALGQSFALTPDIAVATENINSARALIQLGPAPGATWDFIPQDPGAMSVTARVRFNPDRSIDVLEPDGMGGSVFNPTGETAPTGEYFELGVEVDRMTNEFELFLNGQSFYTGTGFAPNIQNVAILGLMEAGTTGDTYDVDNVEIFDGELPAGELGGQSVPTLSTWGLISLGLMVLLVAGFVLRSRVTI